MSTALLKLTDLYWRTSPGCYVAYDKDDTALLGVMIPSCDFEAILISTSPSLMSTVTFSNVNSSHSGTVLTCLNTIIQVNLEADQMANISINVRGITFTTRVQIRNYMCVLNSKMGVHSILGYYICLNLKLLFLGPPSAPLKPFLFSTVPEFCGTFLDSP